LLSLLFAAAAADSLLWVLAAAEPSVWISSTTIMAHKRKGALLFVIGVFVLTSLFNAVMQVRHSWQGFLLVGQQQQPFALRLLLLEHPEEDMERTSSSSLLRPDPLNRSLRPLSWDTTTSQQQKLQLPKQRQYAGHDVNFTLHNGTHITFPSHVTHFYADRRNDRAGAALQDYLMAHAFSFHFERTYGGACGPQTYKLSHHTLQLEMRNALGLEEELPLLDECPDANDTSAMVLDQRVYMLWKDTNIWTPEWIEFIQQRRRRKPPQQENNSDPLMVVHIRRGDVHVRVIPNGAPSQDHNALRALAPS